MMTPTGRRLLPFLMLLLAAALAPPAVAEQGYLMRRYIAGLRAPTQYACDDVIDNVVLLVRGDGGQASDETGNNSLLSVGVAQTSARHAKSGDGALRFPGYSAGYYSIANGGDFDFGAGDFTIEAWIYTGTTLPSPILSLGSASGGSAAALELLLNPNGVTGALGTRLSDGAGSGWDIDNISSAAAAVNDVSWNHVAWSRNGDTLRVFVNGDQVSSIALNPGYGLGGGFGMRLGSAAGDGTYLSAYLDEIRVTKGVGRYFAGFTPKLSFPDSDCRIAGGAQETEPGGGGGGNANTAPQISSIADTSRPAGANASIAVTVGDAETAAAALTLSASSNNQTLVPNGNLAFTGSGANRTLHVLPAAGQVGSAGITVTVSDGQASASTSFTFTADAGLGQWVTLGSIEVMKYEAQNSANGLVSLPGGTPAGSYKYSQARTACQALGVGYDIMTESQWLAIANDAYGVASNWIGGGVGVGTLVRGHSDNSPNSGRPVGTDDSDGYVNTGNNSGQAANAGGEQRRTLTLSNGQVIWDLAGNLVEWVYCDRGPCSGGKQPANTSYSGAASQGSSGSWGASGVDPLLLPGGVSPALGRGQGVGGLFQKTHASTLYVLQRGGWWNSGQDSGAFSLEVNADGEGNNSILTGFRCAKGGATGAPNDAATPSIGTVANQTVISNVATGTLGFTVADSDTPTSLLTVSASSGNTTLVPNANITLGGASGSRTVKVTPATGQTGTATITLTVSDGVRSAASQFTVTVLEATNFKSCAEILAAAPGSTTGQYEIRPDPTGPVLTVQCDMAADGGGWTRLWYKSGSATCTSSGAWTSTMISALNFTEFGISGYTDKLEDTGSGTETWVFSNLESLNGSTWSTWGTESTAVAKMALLAKCRTPTDTAWSSSYTSAYLQLQGVFDNLGESWTQVYYGCSTYMNVGDTKSIRFGGASSHSGEFVHTSCNDYTTQTTNRLTSRWNDGNTRAFWVR